MTYNSLQEIEEAFAEPEVESRAQRRRRLKNKNQAIARFEERLSRYTQIQTTASSSSQTAASSTSPQVQIQSKTTANATLRKQKSRKMQTFEQKQATKQQRRISDQNRYFTRQEELRSQFLKIRHCNLDNYDESIVEGDGIENNRHKFERMNIICEHCQALKWKDEVKGFCCVNGQIILAPLFPAPPVLYNLFTTKDPNTKEPYVNHIRAYNQVLAFTSLGANIDQELANAKEGVYTFKIQGDLYHQIGGLIPKDNDHKSEFAQIYFYDTNLDKQFERRHEIFFHLNPNMLKLLQNELHEINPFVNIFMTAGEQSRNNENENIVEMDIYIHNTHGKDMRQYNQPTASEVAAIVSDINDFSNVQPRDIIVKYHEKYLKRISELHGSYDPLQYPLLFPYGEYGWHGKILRVNMIETEHEFGYEHEHEHEHELEPEHELDLEPEHELETVIPMEIDDDDNEEVIPMEIDDEPADDNNNNNKELNVQKEIKKRKYVTIREFVVYHIQVRDSNKTKSTLHLSGRLFQQYLVDQYVKWESNCLRWHRNNQENLRTEIYSGLQDIISEEDFDTNKIGKKIILSSSFTGSTRYMQQLYHDSMAIVREFGKPDLFITVTCNPNWPEITSELLPNQQASDRPDLVARVFKLKLKSITEDLFVKGILGKVIAHVHVIEFQKRGLPHAHILMVLSPEDKPKTPEDFDGLVSAEIPDKDLQPLLFETVSKNMVHGPCGLFNSSSPCMVEGKCSKSYPREFVETTTINKFGYPIYRRRDNGRTIISKGITIDNRWIVPYNPYLSQKYNCHINVEICSSIRSIKYLYKYVYKGHDRVIISIRESLDEITKYINARYVSASEACWRLFNFGLQERSHKVERLPVYLPNKQPVIYRGDEDEDISKVLQQQAHTKLSRYFEICAKNPGLNLRYIDFPKHFTWNNRNWQPRKRGSEKVISRLYMCSPRDKERFYLRMLLTKIHGATSYENIRTINGVCFETYEEAVQQLGLLDNDDEFIKCFKEAATCKMPSELRQLFASILLFCDSDKLDGFNLLKNYIDELKEDYQKQYEELRNITNDEELTDKDFAIIIRKMLADIERHLIPYNKTLTDFSIVGPNQRLEEEEEEENEQINNLIMEESNYNMNELQDILTKENSLNTDQKRIYNTIIQALNNEINQKVFFIDGPGGYGKTFLFNMILAKVRSSKQIAIAVASSGIAALLLNGGRTAHSKFKIPLKLTESQFLNISKQSELAELIRQTKLIIWDEAPMAHKLAFEAVDRTFRDLTDIDEPFGGKIFIMGGDFRQILPVVIRGTPGQIIDACIKSSNLWKYVDVMHLTINMRIQQDDEQQQFIKYLLQIGEGKEMQYPNIGENIIKLHNDGMILNDDKLESLISRVFYNLEDNFNYNNPNYVNYIKDRAILTTKNENVDDINEQIINLFPGQAHEYLSADSVADKDFVHQNLYPVEFLNTLTPSGTPPHKLILKVGVPIMLLRNLSAAEGLCNGTRLIVKRLHQYIIDAEIITGSHLGKRVFIPRIRIMPSDADLPFQLVRRQFPIRLAFAMTINKAQGQTIPYMGLDLRNPVFAHGQLYVALSRVQSKKNIAILVNNSNYNIEDNESSDIYTKNIVYKEIF